MWGQQLNVMTEKQLMDTAMKTTAGEHDERKVVEEQGNVRRKDSS
jgi:hypothetical protein